MFGQLLPYCRSFGNNFYMLRDKSEWKYSCTHIMYRLLLVWFLDIWTACAAGLANNQWRKSAGMKSVDRVAGDKPQQRRRRVISLLEGFGANRRKGGRRECRERNVVVTDDRQVVRNAQSDIADCGHCSKSDGVVSGEQRCHAGRLGEHFPHGFISALCAVIGKCNPFRTYIEATCFHCQPEAIQSIAHYLIVIGREADMSNPLMAEME
ncbi:hypothetical protein X948_1983 [Burkholderia pseudomallei MSHR5608]|nr:hypothetical protein X948_1983 [Burkholderia pseudomallei MSHR5608]